MLPSALLSRWLSLSNVLDVKPKELSFQLRHIHAHAGARVLFADVPPQARLASHFSNSGLDGNASSNDVYTLRTRRRTAHRPRSHAAFLDARRRSMLHAESAELLWDEEEVEGPDVEDRETLRLLAKMTYNAYVRLFVLNAAEVCSAHLCACCRYVEPVDKDWYDLGDKWTHVSLLIIH